MVVQLSQRGSIPSFPGQFSLYQVDEEGDAFGVKELGQLIVVTLFFPSFFKYTGTAV